jgi:glycerol-3-phosphate acyltransferase PlsX
MHIAVDAMGTDTYPQNDIAGGILAAHELGDTIVFVGDETIIKDELKKHDIRQCKIEIIHAPDHISMDDKPTDVLNSKSTSSMHIAMNAVKNGDADAFVTMGNTGAAHAIATLKTLRRIRGVKRPVLTALFSVNNHQMIFLDVGANTDAKAEWMQQFAIMGSIYAKRVFAYAEPRVALLSNGEENTKGNFAIRETASLLSNGQVNFIGNIEPVELMASKADVIVMDGFVGNIVLKMFEATARYVADLIRDELRNDMFSMLGGLMARPAFNRIRKKIDTSEVGGAPLLGVNGIVIIGHGQNSPIGIKNAIKQAHTAVEANVIEAIQAELSQLSLTLGEDSNAVNSK